MPEPTPLNIFIKYAFSNRRIRQLIDEWRVELDELQRICTRHFEDMGIYMVPFNQRDGMMNNIIHHLINSPEVITARQKGELEELKRRQANRHAG